MNIKEKHTKAMHFAQEAHLALEQGRSSDAISLFKKAFELEKEVAYSSVHSKEPTRSVLLKSAAALANNSKEYREAEKLIALALSGNPPKKLADEIRNLYETINFNRHLELKGIELDNNEIFLSISGNDVSYGMIRADEFLSRAQIIEQLTIRTAERKLGKPYRKGGNIAKELRNTIEPYYQAPMAASFAIKIRLGKPTKQLKLFPDNFTSSIIDELFNTLSLFINEKEDELKSILKEEAYYNNFISLSKRLLPDGDNIKQVGFSIIRKGKQKTLGLTKRYKDIKLEIDVKEEINIKEKPFEIVGSLKKADATRNRITLIPEDKKNYYNIVVPDGLDDLVKLYWDNIVNLKIIKIKKNLYKLIELNKSNEE